MGSRSRHCDAGGVAQQSVFDLPGTRRARFNRLDGTVPATANHSSLPAHGQGVPIRIPVDEWALDGDPWLGGDVLFLVHAGLGYTFSGSWNEEHIFKGWKIDLVKPVRRTPPGGHQSIYRKAGRRY